MKFEAYPGIRDGMIIRQFPLRGAPVSGARRDHGRGQHAGRDGIIEQPRAAARDTSIGYRSRVAIDSCY